MRKLSVGIMAGALGLSLDQLSKYLVDRHLAYSDRSPVIEGFLYLTNVRNSGAAFGLFSGGNGPLQLGLFIAVSIAGIAFLVHFFRQIAPLDRLSALAFGLILGGALGNLVDRVLRGAVVDFLHFRLWGSYAFPDFNLADSFIVVGAAILLVGLLRRA